MYGSEKVNTLISMWRIAFLSFWRTGNIYLQMVGSFPYSADMWQQIRDVAGLMFDQRPRRLANIDPHRVNVC